MGLSKLVDKTRLKTFCGTAHYIAPEVVQGAGLPDSTYNLKVDYCWSLGVILYILLIRAPTRMKGGCIYISFWKGHE